MGYKLELLTKTANQTLEDFKKGDFIETILLNKDIEVECLGIVAGKDESMGFLEIMLANSTKETDPVLVDPKHVRKLGPVFDYLKRLLEERKTSP